MMTDRVVAGFILFQNIINCSPSQGRLRCIYYFVTWLNDIVQILFFFFTNFNKVNAGIGYNRHRNTITLHNATFTDSTLKRYLSIFILQNIKA